MAISEIQFPEHGIVPATAFLPAPPRGALVDRFGRRHTYLRISVTERCNLRCRYCMPADGVPLSPRESILTSAEILRVARVFTELGIKKIRLTGGEPLTRHGFPRLAAGLAALPGVETLGMTTNGLLLAPHAAGLHASGLNRLNVSLDTFRPERFKAITLRDGLDRVLAGIEAALAAGFVPLKLNMVVMRGVNDDELLDFVEFARDRPVHVRFIEFMPFAGNAWSQNKMVPYAEMRETIGRRHTLSRAGGLHDPHNTAREFCIPGFQGRVAFITSMTNDFCGACNRVRLTADGNIKSCLFHNGELNVRDVIRSGGDDDAIEAVIRRAVLEKPAGHASLESLNAQPNRSMITIGG